MILILKHHIKAASTSDEPTPIAIPRASFAEDSFTDTVPASTSSTERFMRVLGFVFHICSVVLAQEGGIAKCSVHVVESQSSELISNKDLLQEMAAVKASTKCIYDESSDFFTVMYNSTYMTMPLGSGEGGAGDGGDGTGAVVAGGDGDEGDGTGAVVAGGAGDGGDGAGAVVAGGAGDGGDGTGAVVAGGAGDGGDGTGAVVAGGAGDEVDGTGAVVAGGAGDGGDGTGAVVAGGAGDGGDGTGTVVAGGAGEGVGAGASPTV
jgi:hypothetical protein